MGKAALKFKHSTMYQTNAIDFRDVRIASNKAMTKGVERSNYSGYAVGAVSIQAACHRA